MLKPWSISTTVRNPERLRDFLIALQPLVGKEWNTSTQEEYQKILIKNRVYGYGKSQFYSGLPKELVDLINDRDSIISDQEVDRIVELKKYTDFPIRGRQSLNPLTKFGFALVDDGIIKITDLGRKLIASEKDSGDAFLRSFIKWQIPNPSSIDYPDDGSYNIVPFVGMLKLISEVNRLEIERGGKANGVTKREYSLFAPTLIDHKNITTYAQKIIDFRDLQNINAKPQERKAIRNKYRHDFAFSFLGLTDNTYCDLSKDVLESFLSKEESKKILKQINIVLVGSESIEQLASLRRKVEVIKLLNNLKDYGDNAIWYFRLTKFIRIRGGGFYIDLEPSRSIEIESLLENEFYKPKYFSGRSEYFQYMSDDNTPVLPWQTKSKLLEIISNIDRKITILKQKLDFEVTPLNDTTTMSEDELTQYIEELRLVRKNLQEKANHVKSQPIEAIGEYIKSLEKIYEFEDRALKLEYLSTLGLHSLNDAIEIKPNYPVGDDNKPTSTAPGGVADIECFYSDFNMICEVTMLKSRDQWYNEGQPVMRHLRDFENRHSNAYCLFIAPTIHTDTAETFWISNIHGYKGVKQKIAPITIKQFVFLLKSLKKLRENGGLFNHNKLEILIISIIDSAKFSSDSDEWIDKIDNIIVNWSETLLAKQK